MDDCPPEIWSKTCSFACTDDGRTGRSLSLVSCSFNAILKPYKLQSVAVVGRRQLLAFAALLERTPPLLRRVICIYLFYYQGLRGTSLEEIEEEHVEVCHAVECILTAIMPSVRMLHKWVAPPLQYGLPGFVHLKLLVLEELVEPRPPHTPPAWGADADIELTALRYLNLTYSMRHPLQDLAWYLADAKCHTSFFSLRTQRKDPGCTCQ